MHILLVHQAFATEAEPGGTRHYELGTHLARKGHKVTVVASTMNYQTRRSVNEWYGGAEPGSALDEIRILRAWAYPARRGRFWERLLAFVSFMVSSFIKGLSVGKVDIVWGTSPPIFQALTAYALARCKRVPFVLEIRDLWPDFAIQTGVLHNGLLIWLSRRLERFLYRHADRIIVNSPGFVPHLVSCGAPGELVELVPNGVDVAMFSGANGQEVRKELGVEGRFVAMYAGAHGLANDLETVLEAAIALREHRDIVFVLVGEGVRRRALMQQAADSGLSNVLFVDPQPKSRIPAFLAAADVCMASLKAVPMFDTTYPNKVFDYMAAGRPTILAIDGPIREVIEKADGGLFVPQGDAQALTQALLTYTQEPELRRRQGDNARKYVALHFDRPLQATKLEEVLQKTCQSHVKKGVLGLASKRLLDLTVALIGLVSLPIPFLLVALAIKLNSRGPLFFRQERVGYRGRTFRPWKFRTMVEGASSRGLGYNLIQGDSRITRVGRVLRDWGIDELPQLINVLKGEMSLVGPRPALKPQVDHYDEGQRQRLLVKPGITGWALIHGRNQLKWEERIKYDVWYVQHASFWLDLTILVKTLKVVLVTREGLYEKDGGLDDSLNKYL